MLPASGDAVIGIGSSEGGGDSYLPTTTLLMLPVGVPDLRNPLLLRIHKLFRNIFRQQDVGNGESEVVRWQKVGD